MNKFFKFIWTIFSYGPLFLILSIILFVDFITKKQITCFLWPVILLIGLAFMCFVGSLAVIRIAAKKIAKTKLNVSGAASKDTELTATMTAYLLPLLTLVFSEVNIVAFVCLVAAIAVIVFCTKTVYINPFVYVFGYKYYSVQTVSGMTYTLITQQKRFNPQKVENVVELFQEIYMEV